MLSLSDVTNVVPRRAILAGVTPEGFGTYHDLVQSSGATTARHGDTFEAAVTAYRFPHLMLFDRQLTGADHRRDSAQIRRDGFEHFYLQVLRSGRMASGAPDGGRWLAPGDAVLFDATQPQRTLVSAADYVTVTLPRPLIEATVPDARRLHGRILPRAATSGIGDAVLALARLAPGMTFGDAVGGDRMIATLLGEIAGLVRGRASSEDDSEIDASRRLQAGLYIDANLGRQDLDVSAIAQGLRLSRSTLYRVFSKIGGIEREITRRRVARLRSALLRPNEARSIDVLAHALGFATPSHCSRVFKEAYGLAPNLLRAELRAIAAEAASAMEVDLLNDWYAAMNGNGMSN